MNPKFVTARSEKSSLWAFTLIELLAVIAIIGLLAALVLGLSGVATTKSREARMKGEHAKLVTAIETYKIELGNYPPDNPDTNLNERVRLGRSSLFYELAGATFESPPSGSFFKAQAAGFTIKPADLKTVFGVTGIDNSARNKKDIPRRGETFKPSQYAELDLVPEGGAVVLISPLKGPYDSDFKKKGGGVVNPWFYDTSSTNRHNPESYDLWTEYLGPNRTNVISNWKD